MAASERMLGEFALRAKIGEGGFGAVYHAEQLTLGREAAVKVLHGRRSEERVRQRFLREAQIACRLDHPYAAHVYAFGAEDDGTLWIAMEYVRGATLAELLRRGPLPLDRFVPLFERLAEVVATAHEQGIVHRDLKPANVMVIERAGKLIPKLLDLGIARLARTEPSGQVVAPVVVPPVQEIADTTLDLRRVTPSTATPSSTAPPMATEQGVAMGSPPYMAPEQWDDSHSVDGRADLYALGVLAYEALTGQLPFDARNVAEMEHAHRSTPPPRLPASFPPALSDVIVRALAKRADDRWAGALELAAALRLAAGMGESAPPLPTLDDDTRGWLLDVAPQPIAETAQGLDASRNPHELGSAVRAVTRVLVRALALLALAARTRRPMGATDSDEARALLSQLRRRELVDGEWLALTRELVRGFAERPETHPIPELVRLCFDGEPLVVEPPEGAAGPDEVAALARLCQRCDFLERYPWIVNGERWTGVRRPLRATFPVIGELRADEVLVCDLAGRPILSLAPLVQARPPSPGAPLELFLFAGPGRRGARLTSFPQGFTREDDELWGWIGARILASDETPATAREERSPFPGLAPFTRDDAARFLGREAEIDGFVNRLRSAPLLAVVGPSGAGKSSFVHAGVLAALPAEWRVATCRPGPRPLMPGEADVIVVDQLEELFTQGAPPGEVDRFALALAERGARIIVTLRDDFLMRAEKLPGLGPLIARGVVLVGTPPARELRRILVASLAHAGYAFDDDALADEMVAAVDGVPGALPLLSFTAAELWELRDRPFHKLTRRAYDSLGGVGGALARHAETTLAGLPEPARKLVREAFRHLVTAEGTRAVHTRRELEELLGGGAAGTLVETLVGARLLTTSEGPDGDRIEVAHEALLDAWPRLVEWRREDREGARLRDQLRAATRQWEERARPSGLLWRGDALAELRLWRARHPGPLTAGEAAFAQASERDDARGRRIRTGLLVGATLVLAVTSVILYSSSRASRRSSDEARARLVELFLEQGRLAHLGGEDGQALVYLDEARRRGASGPELGYLMARAADVVGRQRRTLVGHRGEVRDVSFSPDGERIVSEGEDGTARIWDWRRGALLATLSGPVPLRQAAFVAGGARVVTAGFDGHLRLFDAATGAQLADQDLGDHYPFVFRVSEDGERVVSAAPTGVIRSHRTTDLAARVLAWLPPLIFDVCGQGSRFATAAQDGTTVLWHGERVVAVLAGHTDIVRDCTFSPDGRWLATASHDGTARVWDAETGHLVSTLSGHSTSVRSVAFAPDGATVITGSEDGTAKIWDTVTGSLRRSLAGHAGQVLRAEPSPDGRTVATAGGDGVAIVWQARTGLPAIRLLGNASLVNSARFSRDGASLVTAGADGTVRVFDVRGEPLLHLELDPLSAVAFDPEGRLVTVGSDGKLRVWTDAERFTTASQRVGPLAFQLTPGAEIAVVIPDLEVNAVSVVRVHDGRVLAEGLDPGIAFQVSPDTRLAAAALVEPIVGLRPLAPGAVAGELSLRSPALGVAWSADSARLAVWTKADRTEVWDVATRRRLADLPGGKTAAFAPDGRLVTSDGSRAVHVWSDDGVAMATMHGHANHVFSLAFDGPFLITGSSDETVRVWSLASGAELGRLHHQTGIIRGLQVSRGRVLAQGTYGDVLVYDLGTAIAPLEDPMCRIPWAIDAQSTRLVRRECGTDAATSSPHEEQVQPAPRAP